MKTAVVSMDVNNTKSMNEITKNIRWGIIGCGNVTEFKSGPAYQKTAGFTIEAVMRRDQKKWQIMPKDMVFLNSIQMPMP